MLVDPIGLEDWKAKGVPWQSVDDWYSQELQSTADRIRDYERTTYYAGHVAAGLRDLGADAGRDCTAGRDGSAVAWNSALLYDMIYTQPVVYELALLTMPVLLMIGDKDTTAIGKALAAPGDPRHPGQLPGARTGGRRGASRTRR